jgi:RHS repeat-associated protein
MRSIRFAGRKFPAERHHGLLRGQQDHAPSGANVAGAGRSHANGHEGRTMRHRFRPILFGFFLAAAVRAVRAQTPVAGPDENPTANTGALKAQIETGGSYDAHSGNATRIIPDLHFPGAVGVYGLDFTRYWNSLRNDRDPGSEYLHPEPVPDQPTDFGSPGWSHSWSWHADYEQYLQEVGGDGGQEIYWMSITITFPDGHASKYTISRSNQWVFGQTWSPDPRFGQPYYAAHGEANWSPSGDIHDYLEGMAENGSEFWLHRADGGTVHFVDSAWGYQAAEVLDPHGLLTTLHYNTDGNLDWVEQDGGRRLTLRWDCYSPPGQQNPCMEKVIGRVENAGATMQAVEYGYSWLGDYLTLTHAYYQNDPVPGQSVGATYTYESYTPPTGFFYAGPLLVTADDPRFAGPMRQIRYSYRESGCRPVGQPEPGYQDGKLDYFYASPTSIAAEQSWRTVGNVPIVVSSFTLGCFDGTRSESNGLGGFRKFFYGRSAGAQGTYHCLGYQLAKLTDFTTVYPLPSNLPFERQNYLTGEPREIWDGRGILTEPVYGDGSGFPSEVHHTGSDGSRSTYDRVNPGNSEAQDFSRVPNPYHHWLFSKTDERAKTTVYTRDSRRRVKHIAYDNGSAEDFTYDPVTNQVTSHTLPSGAVQYYHYNGSNQLDREWNSVDGESVATTYTYYGGSNHPEWTGLVATELNPRAAANGAAYSTMMEYNGRFQITKVHYPATGGNSDPTITYGYDANGNCTSITDEMGHTSLYEYDDYRRCTSYTEPLNASNWNGSAIETSRRWDWFYDRYIEGVGQRDAYAHTKNEWRIQIEPAFNSAGDRRMTARTHDLQNRISTESTGWIQPAGPLGNWYWSADGENHSWTYDENGQKKTYTDPQNRLTTYTYDLRNRLKDTIETKRADQSVNPTTTILYDTTGNKTDVTFPDGRSQHWQDYDPFGQGQTFIDERANRTDLSYCWGPMKKLCTVTTHRAKDGGGTEDQQTVFWFDPMGRPTEVHFPLPDGSTEISTYEFGQLKTWKTRKNQTKTIVYDVRGREVSHSWDDGVTPAVARSWDDANRLSSISNIWSSIDYGYDDAGQVIWEGDEIAGSGGRTQTNYYRYPDGNIAHLHYPGGAYVRHDYTARGQLAATGWDDDDNNWWMKLAAYTYLADGKVGRVDCGNGIQSTIGYDERGFIKTIDHYNVPANQDYSSRQYWRDNRDRITAFQKSYNPGANPMENGRGDRFHYDDEGQLQEGWYNATDPSNSGAGNTRYDGFSYDALGNRGQGNYVASRGQMDFIKKDNGLNQYHAWMPYSYTNYDDDIGGTWGSPGAANGVLMQDGWVTAGFNALNQPMYITSPTYYGTSNWMHFGYDPLGRCVKRWAGDSGDVYSNPATYFHYDGWNLLQEGNNAWGPARVYVHGNRMDEVVWSYNTFTGEQAFHHYDARGHCTLLTDSVGNILEQYEYDAFGWPYFYDANGNAIGAYDPVQNLWEGYSQFGNRFLFTGREWISDLKLYDYRNRMYQPELGRFLQPDSKQFTAGDYNLYRYCHNDPVNKRDPLGLLEANQEDKELAKPVLVKDTYRPVTGSHIPIHIRVFNSGNWNDRTVAHHATDNLERDTGKAGLTRPSGSSNVSGANVDVYMHVDWYYDTRYNGTDVITREMQHVQDARGLERGYWDGTTAASLSDFGQFANIVKGFTIMQKFKYDQKGGPHDLNAHPAMPAAVPEYDEAR